MQYLLITTIHGQVVISGEEKAIEKVSEVLKENGAKKIIFLNTNGPFHTIKLEKAKKEFEKELEKIKIQKGTMKVLKNINGLPYCESDNVKEVLARHMVNPIRFDKVVEYMKSENIDNFIEIGPGRTLTGFIKKEITDAKMFNINNVENLEKFLNN